jgi:hypothetical protein
MTGGSQLWWACDTCGTPLAREEPSAETLDQHRRRCRCSGVSLKSAAQLQRENSMWPPGLAEHAEIDWDRVGRLR